MNAPPLLYYPDFYPDPTWLRAVLLLNDKLYRIVPNDVQLDDPEALREIEGELGGLGRIAPNEVHTNPYGDAADWLERTLEIIKRELNSNKDQRESCIEFSDGRISFPGNVFVYDKKLSDRVYGMLRRNDLIDREIQELEEHLHGSRKGVVLPAAAANAILSFIADSIARDQGLTPITDQALMYAMTTMAGLHLPLKVPKGADEGLLSGAFASILLPREIGQINFSDYRILRDRSAELRRAFGNFVQQCAEACRLERIESTATLQKKIENCADDVSKEFKKFQTGTQKALRLIRDWWPLMIGGMLTLAKDLVPPEWSLTFGAAGQGVKFAQQAFMPSPNHDKEKMFSLAAALGRDVRLLPKVSQLVSSQTALRAGS